MRLLHRRAHPAALAPGRRHPAGRLRGHPGAALGRRWPGAPARSPPPRSSRPRTSSPRAAQANQQALDECLEQPGATSASREARGRRAGLRAVPGIAPRTTGGTSPGSPSTCAGERRGHRPRRDQPAGRPDHAGRHHLRRPRLEQRLDEQPAALRAPTTPGLAGQGGGGLRDLAGGQRRRPRPVVGCGVAARRVPRRPGQRARLGPIAASAARGSLLAAGAAVGGYALTMLFRSTVATLGVMFAVAVAGQAVFVAVLGESAMRWVLPTNIAAFLFNGYDYYDGSSGTELRRPGQRGRRVRRRDGAPQPGLRDDVPAGPARHRRRPLPVVVPAPRRALTARARGHVHRNWAAPGPGVE